MTHERLIDTRTFGERMRQRVLNLDTQEVLIARIEGSDQEIDLSDPPNCGGLGRIRHFRRVSGSDWPSNPLPLDPAHRALSLPPADMVRAQVFQLAACAWRCWYCYVPFNLLNGDSSRGVWMNATKLVGLFAEEPDRPTVIDLSGGSPDLAPEWVGWIMDALEKAGLADATYLWSDDNLSTDYVFSHLSDCDRRRLAQYRNYGRVCCFKGFDPESFAFNTGAEASGYEAQFDLFKRYLALGLDLYGYVTLTGPNIRTSEHGVRSLIEKLRTIDEALPLRVVPLKVDNFTPTRERDSRRSEERFSVGAEVQRAAIEIWRAELERIYSNAERSLPICDVPIGVRR